jgi:hypothetical protein
MAPEDVVGKDWNKLTPEQQEEVRKLVKPFYGGHAGAAMINNVHRLLASWGFGPKAGLMTSRSIRRKRRQPQYPRYTDVSGIEV